MHPSLRSKTRSLTGVTGESSMSPYFTSVDHFQEEEPPVPSPCPKDIQRRNSVDDREKTDQPIRKIRRTSECGDLEEFCSSSAVDFHDDTYHDGVRILPLDGVARRIDGEQVGASFLCFPFPSFLLPCFLAPVCPLPFPPFSSSLIC